MVLAATVHCLTGCATGEILGLAIGTQLGWGNRPTIILAVALASDTVSIAIMELVDNGIMLFVPAHHGHSHHPH